MRLGNDDPFFERQADAAGKADRKMLPISGRGHDQFDQQRLPWLKTEQGRQTGEDQDGRDQLQRMMTEAERHIDRHVAVMDTVEAPQQRHAVEGAVEPVAGECAQEQSDGDDDPARRFETLEDAEVVVICPGRRSGNRQRDGKADRDSGKVEAEIGDETGCR